MSSPPGKTVHHSSVGSISGTHDVIDADDVLLAPTTEDEKNTIRAAILPIACFRIEDARFDFDSSFVLPKVADEIPKLADLRSKHQDPKTKVFPPLSVFGHADPTGSDDYNKSLSGRRSTALYALLTRRIDLWEQLYSHPLGRDDWKTNGITTMLDEVGLSSTEADVKNTKNNAVLRAQLFQLYMDKLAGTFQLKPTDFLAQGQDPKGKGDFQGCSDFNPVLIFSKKDETRFAQAKDHTERNAANASNRRVMIFLYRPGSKVSPGHWPCPRASEGVTDCHKRFWSDAEKRRHTHLPDDARHYEDTHDTFACRFYDRMANDSPCERIVLVTTLTIRMMDGDDQPFKNARFSLIVLRNTGAQDNTPDDIFNGITNDNGILSVTIPADADRAHLTLFPTGSGTDPNFVPNPTPANPAGLPPDIWNFDLLIKPLAPADTIAGAQARLNNLGLFASKTVDEAKTTPVGDIKTIPDLPDSKLSPDQLEAARLKRAVQRFQMLYKPNGAQDLADGNMDAPTKAKLEEKHGS